MAVISHYRPRYPVAPQVMYAPVYSTIPVEHDGDGARFPSFLACLTGISMLSVPIFSHSGRFDMPWIPQVLAGAVGLAWVIIGLTVKRQGIVWARPMTLYLVWAVWAALGVVVTPNTEVFWVMWGSAFKVSVYTFIACQCVRTRADLIACLMVISVAGIAVFWEGVDKILIAATATSHKAATTQRLTSDLMGNSNDMGLWAVVVLLGNVACLLTLRHRVFWVLPLASIPCVLYIIAACGSRTAMVDTFLVAAGLYYFHFRKLAGGQMGRRLLMIFLGVGVLGATLLFISQMPFLWRLTEVFSSVDSMKEEPRYVFFINGLKALPDHAIIGLGLGGFLMSGLGGAKGLYSHSTIMEVVTCTGLPGLFLYYWAHYAMFKVIRQLRKAPLPKSDFAMVNVSMILLCITLCGNIVGVLLDSRYLWPLVGAFCGYLWNLKRVYLDPAPAVLA